MMFRFQTSAGNVPTHSHRAMKTADGKLQHTTNILQSGTPAYEHKTIIYRYNLMTFHRLLLTRLTYSIVYYR